MTGPEQVGTLTQAQGWTQAGLRRRIAEELAWQPDKTYWEEQLARADGRLDQILDPLGRPGDPLRETHRLHDPLVRALQADRRTAIAQIEAEDPVWQVRAERIARTESTGAANYAALQALAAEGATHKQWLAARDKRTRDSHAEADGQVQPLKEPFLVGDSPLMMPGDPNGPARETVNCRCTMISADPADGLANDVKEDAPVEDAPAEEAELRALRPSISDATRQHILVGDRRGGGHRYPTQKAGKTQFPEGWDDDRIMAAIQVVLDNPRAVQRRPGWILVYGEIDRVRILVRLARGSGEVETAHPIDGDGVTRSRLVRGALVFLPVLYGANQVVQW